MKKSPIRHHVRQHKRKERPVHDYVRGKGSKTQKIATPTLGKPKSKGVDKEKVEKMIADHPFINVEKDQIKDVFMYKDYPVAIVSTHKFGGIWNPDNNLIMFDSQSWDDLNDSQREIVLEHEIVEKKLAMPNYREYSSHSKAVAANHDKANEILFRKYGKDAVLSALEKVK